MDMYGHTFVASLEIDPSSTRCHLLRGCMETTAVAMELLSPEANAFPNGPIFAGEFTCMYISMTPSLNKLCVPSYETIAETSKTVSPEFLTQTYCAYWSLQKKLKHKAIQRHNIKRNIRRWSAQQKIWRLVLLIAKLA